MDNYNSILPTISPALSRENSINNPEKRGLVRFLSKYLKPKNKVKPQKKITYENFDNDTTSYIRCIFHDLRGPLNNITLGTESLFDSFNKDSVEYSTLSAIKESCVFMGDSLDGFLNINNLDNAIMNELQPVYNPFNIIGLVKKIQYILFFNILKKKINLNYKIQKIQEWVVGDCKQLQHVLMNLLSNAIKFSVEKSNIEIKVEGGMINNGRQHICIYIIDENPFIPPDIKSKLFQKYNTSDNQEGTGLGLYMCKTIIESHGGIINHFIDTSKTRGNIFKVELFLETSSSSSTNEDQLKASTHTNSRRAPSIIDSIKHGMVRAYSTMNIKKGKSLESIENVTKDKMFGGSASTKQLSLEIALNDSKKMKMMAIDDSDLSRKFMIRIINQNYTDKIIYEAVDGLDALIQLVKFNEIGNVIHLLLIDNMMPNINGELLSKILRSIGFQGMIVGITGNGVQKDIDQYINNGADYVFVKPFNKEKMKLLFDFIEKEGSISKKEKKIVEKNGVLEWV